MIGTLRSGAVFLAAVLALAAPARAVDCPEGSQPQYNAALERVVCVGIPGSGSGGNTPPRSVCPPGEQPVTLQNGEIHCLNVHAVPAQLCVGPYRQMTQAGCEWTCGAGTRPDEASGQCQCEPGYVETGTDAQGRRTCALDPGSLIEIPGRPALERDPAGTPVLPPVPGPRQLPVQPAPQ